MGELRVFAVSGEDLMDIWNTHFLSLSFIYWIFHYDEIAHEIEKRMQEITASVLFLKKSNLQKKAVAI